MDGNRKKLQTVLDEVFEISRIPMLLYNGGGELVAHTAQPEPSVTAAAKEFAVSGAESQTLGSYQYFKITRSGAPYGVLLAGNFAPDTAIVARLTVCQIRRLLEAREESLTKSTFVKGLADGSLPPAETERQRRKLKLNAVSWAVYLIECDEGFSNSSAYELLEQAFAGRKADLCCELDDGRLLLAKDVSNLAKEYKPPSDDIPCGKKRALQKDGARLSASLEKFAQTIVDTLRAEVMIQTHVGYSSVVDSFDSIRRGYGEASAALRIRRTFFTERDTAAYTNLGIGRLISGLPADLCHTFLHEVFGDSIPDGLSEEEQNTIQKFYENNLNISETARQLYLHRNTLVYRLERLEKKLGLDIRRFDDAMTFKLAMMVLAHLRCDLPDPVTAESYGSRQGAAPGNAAVTIHGSGSRSS